MNRAPRLPSAATAPRDRRRALTRAACIAIALAAPTGAACSGKVIQFNPNDVNGSTTGASTSGATTMGGTATGGTTTGSSTGSGPVLTIPHDRVDKIDLLFMIDNSSSMGDKQELLAAAIPDLLARFLTPNCVDVNGAVSSRAGGNCPTGTAPEFPPIDDIHIAVISSSLGSHGADTVAQICPDIAFYNDGAHLLTRGANLTIPPFLNWNSRGMGAGAITNQAQLQAQFAALVTGVGETGCGYEAQLESIYRFLIDPTPPANLMIGSGNAAAYGTVDTTILQQRQQFLRPDSLVAVIAVTDENDCSISDVGNANLYLVSDASGADPYFPDSNVNDRTTLYKNHPNLRCFHQAQRFGTDGMWPIDRYVNGFSNLGNIISNKDGAGYPNPLFTDLSCPPTQVLSNLPNGSSWPVGAAGCTTNPKVRQDKTFVFFAGIVGVPWQDIARTGAGGTPDLTFGYMNAAEIFSAGRWDTILADGITPGDPFMIESRTPRQTGSTDPVPSVKGGTIADPMSASATAAINGHEWNPVGDLEFACTFPIDALTGGTGKECSATTICDCYGSDDPATSRNPLCQTAQNTFSSTQHYAKAYPGIRELQVLRSLGDQAVVASICPADTTNTNSAAYGYRPAVGAIVDKLKTKLTAACPTQRINLADPCLGTTPTTATYDQVDCIIIETRRLDPTAGCTCPGDPNFPGRITIPTAHLSAVPAEILDGQHCNCEIQQLSSANMAAQNTCLQNATITDDQLEGWCYVDPANGLGNPAIVSRCSPTPASTLRYPPRAGSTAYISCSPTALGPPRTCTP